MTKIGFIGQGWIGKHYADDFEERLYDVVRYALEEPYVQNKDAIRECDIVFVAVPTPTTEDGFDYSPVSDALTNIKPGATVVIKSTLRPGTTEALQTAFPELYVMHSPEFLRESMAAYDAAHPDRNLIGIPEDTEVFRERAVSVLKVLPEAPYDQIMSAKEAEIVKYAGNCFLTTKVLFMNLLYDLVKHSDADWTTVREAMINDPRIGASHTEPVHASGHHDTKDTKTLRGAGGHCFIKDFEAFRALHHETVGDATADEVLKTLTEFNIKLLNDSGKDLDLLQGVFGTDLSVIDYN